MASKNMSGCAYGKVSRNMIDNLKETMEHGFKDFGKSLDRINETQKELFNHQSSRLPLWVTIMFTIGGSLITGLIIWAITK